MGNRTPPQVTTTAAAFAIIEGMVDPSTIIASIAVGVPTLAGTWFTARYSLKSKQTEVEQAQEAEREAARVREAQLRHDERQTFVEQLQAERQQQRDIITNKDQQIDKFWRDKSASRDYIHQLKRQIWEGADPPPVSPPAGYIE